MGLLPQESDQNRDPLPHLIQDSRRNFAEFLRSSVPPVDTFQLVGENHTADFRPRGKLDFKRIILDLAGNGAQNRETSSFIVGSRGEHNRRAAPRLFMAYLRYEINPDNVASIRDVVSCYHCSIPTGFPQSVSE